MPFPARSAPLQRLRPLQAPGTLPGPPTRQERAWARGRDGTGAG